jgi:hypothetical protein
MRLREKAGGVSEGLEPISDPLLHPIDEDLSIHPNEQRSLAGDPESLGAPELDEALKNFRSSVHAWSAAEYSRVRPTATIVRQRSWRLAAGWALAGVLVAGGAAGGGVYKYHQRELRIAAARVAEQQRTAREQRAREVEEEDLLAKVDSDVSRVVPSAMEPLTELMAEDETR